ncbi:MAG: type II toxin-antitoxin system VapC family toxin [Myxococcota bacterium]
MGRAGLEVNGLLDTHTLLWWLFDDPKLSARARAFIADSGNTLFVSSVSAWEIATRYRIGKLRAVKTLVQDISGWIERAGFQELAVRVVHGQRAGLFANAHRDPFDRMLAAQSIIEDLPIISTDDLLDSFGAKRIW